MPVVQNPCRLNVAGFSRACSLLTRRDAETNPNYIDVSESMPGATIRLYLIFGDPRRLRTAEIGNWSGKAVAAPRSDFDAFLSRPELGQSGVYILSGRDPETDEPAAYMGEAENLKSRILHHKSKDYWNSIYVFLSKDENLTKAHVRFLEYRLLQDAHAAGRVLLLNGHGGGGLLPESDRDDMELFLEKVHQLLPVLGSELLTKVGESTGKPSPVQTELFCSIKGLTARGARTPEGFVVLKGSQAVGTLRPSAPVHLKKHREKLIADGALVPEQSFLRFAKDVPFDSPSGAGSVVRGGNSNGLVVWKTSTGKTLGELETDGSN